MTIALELTDAGDQSHWEAVAVGLRAFNQPFAGVKDQRPLAVLIRREGQIVGGLWGHTAFGWLFVELLFSPADLRGGMGTRLMDMAEDEARRRGCRHAWLDTYSFQARGFYEKRGYQVFGQLDDYPPGHVRYFLRRDL